MLVNHSFRIIQPQWNFLCSVNLFLDLQCTIPYPNDMQPPLWLFMLQSTPYLVSTHVHNWIIMFSPKILLQSIVCFRYCNTCLNLSLPSLVILITLVHSNMYVYPCRALHFLVNILVLQLYSVGCPHLYFLFLWVSHQFSTTPSLPEMITLCLVPLQKNNQFFDVILHKQRYFFIK